MEGDIFMSRSNIFAWSFLGSGAFMLICCFLPVKTVTADGLILAENEVYKLMPTLWGFIVLALSIACIVIPVVGLKEKAALAGSATALMAGFSLWRISASADSAAKLTGSFGSLMNELSSATQTRQAAVTTGAGFYLTIIALILVLATGFAYTIIDDN